MTGFQGNTGTQWVKQNNQLLFPQKSSENNKK